MHLSFTNSKDRFKCNLGMHAACFILFLQEETNRFCFQSLADQVLQTLEVPITGARLPLAAVLVPQGVFSFRPRWFFCFTSRSVSIFDFLTSFEFWD